MIAWLLIPATWLVLAGLALLVMIGAHAMRHRKSQRRIVRRLRRSF